MTMESKFNHGVAVHVQMNETYHQARFVAQVMDPYSGEPMGIAVDIMNHWFIRPITCFAMDFTIPKPEKVYGPFHWEGKKG